MQVLLLIVLIVSLNSKLTSQSFPGAKQIALSHSDVAQSNDVFSLFNNPAGLAQMNWRELGIYYSPSPFGFSELSHGFIAYNEPINIGSVGIGVMTYGFDLYRENLITTGFSYNYLNKFFGGATICFHTVSIKNYGSDNAFYINIGGLYYLTESFRIGFSCQNINRASFGSEKDNIPLTFRTGFSYDPLDELTFNFALEKDIRYNYSIRGGVDYNILNHISLRTGFMNEPSQYSLGIGVNYSFVSLDYAFFTHNDLGATHQAGLIISFGLIGSRTENIRKNLDHGSR